MDEKRIYKLCLLLPIVVPAISYVLMRTVNEFPGNWTPLLLLLIFKSLEIGGVPYLLVAAFLLYWMRDKDATSIRGSLMLSPILMIVVTMVLFSGYAVWLSYVAGAPQTFVNYASLGMVYCCFILLFGYFYVFLTLAIARYYRKKPVESLPE